MSRALIAIRNNPTDRDPVFLYKRGDGKLFAVIDDIKAATEQLDSAQMLDKHSIAGQMLHNITGIAQSPGIRGDAEYIYDIEASTGIVRWSRVENGDEGFLYDLYYYRQKTVQTIMAKQFNYKSLAEAPSVQSATETMVKAFEQPQQPQQTQQTHPLTPSRKEGGGIDTPTVQSGSDVSTHNTPPLTPAPSPTPTMPAVQSTSLPSPNNGEGQGIGSVMTPVEHLAQRRLQIQSEFNGAAVQAINLKTFPEAGNWKLEEVVRKFNLKRTPGTPKLTKGALAEMILLDAVSELYDKVCGN